MSLVRIRRSVNRKLQVFERELVTSGGECVGGFANYAAGSWRLIVSEEFLGIFHETDEDNNGGANEADKEHDLKQTHGE